ncbi:hypothetical protein [Gilliamella sp. wkB112]|uniref:hypothetical protein n=1 Tax=Gilliamella sp. wkB112 TaxID=3120257 RepID=UPI00080DD418|nr:hypothetical protein [Gilliamella apicola]OCG00822.1 hypothetical protein A9G12_03395 [Gilliamella apicola]
MQYNNEHCQYFNLNFLKYVLAKLFLLRFILVPNYLSLSWLRLSFISTKYLSKVTLALIPLLFLSYSINTQALLASTVKFINGSSPYLTYDNGVTKITTTDGLLGITISDGTSKTTYTPANNISTADNPIVLLKENQSFADIGMLVPPTTDSITLNALIGAPYNYWGDDDGDGQGTNGVTATGNLSVSITDKENNAVSRNTVLSICDAPYKVVLTSTNGSLTTQYGVPNSSNFSSSNATYYISPKSNPKICYARPNLDSGEGEYAGPDIIWNPKKGFLVQSTESSSYSRNFPTTGANKMYFYLEIGGINVSTLTWPTVTRGDFTVTMEPSNDDLNPTVRVILTGPVVNSKEASEEATLVKPILPQTFEIVGYDNSNSAVLKYGFVLKEWFVARKSWGMGYQDAERYCSSYGYRLPNLKELTNSLDTSSLGFVGATPSSNGNWYQRNIGTGLLSEWGATYGYYETDSDITYISKNIWSSSTNENKVFYVSPDIGMVGNSYLDWVEYFDAICVYP